MRTVPLTFLLACLLAGCSAPPALDAALQELLQRPELAGARIGVAVVDAATWDARSAAWLACRALLALARTVVDNWSMVDAVCCNSAA